MARTRKTHAEFASEVRQAHGTSLELLTKYDGCRAFVLVVCKICGKKSSRRPPDIISKGCNTCHRKSTKRHNRKTHEEFVREVNEVHNGKVIITSTYVDNRTRVEAICKCGRNWTVAPNNLLVGAKCRQCYTEKRTKSTEKYLQDLAAKNPELLVDSRYDFSNIEYKGSLKNLKGVVCKLHGPVSPIAGGLLQKQGPCPKCGRESSRNKIVKSAEVYLKRCHALHENAFEYLDLTDEKLRKGKGARQEFLMKHKKCGNVMSIILSSHLQGKGCNPCKQRERELKRKRLQNESKRLSEMD